MQSIEGQLLTIAESWPLQLTVQPTDQGPPWSVRVGDDTLISLRGNSVQALALRNSQRLSASGILYGAESLQAQTIEVF
jgi:hypothetical protein